MKMAGGSFSLEPKVVPVVSTPYRVITTKLPVPESLDIIQGLDATESRSMHGQMPIVWDRAEGFQVYDAWGNKWLDFTSTIFVANTGHGNPRILNALKKVLDKPLLHTYSYYSQERADYISYLIKHTPSQFEKAFLLSAGTEATECALKLMRMHGQKRGKKRLGIIAFEGNWHGRTLGAQMMSYNPKQKEWVGYHDPNIFHLAFPYPWVQEAAENPEQFFEESMHSLLLSNGLNPETDLCGFMIETFQGWGALFYPKAFMQAVEKFARKYGMLLTFDEMQAGFARTGELFGYMHYEVQPDILCCGKGASSSLPLSIVLGSSEIMDLPDVGSMSSTHSANPLVCAAGLANVQTIIEDGLVEKTRNLGELFITKLQDIQKAYSCHVALVAGKGLLAALHFKDAEGKPLSELATAICTRLLERGLLVVHTGRETIKLAPPLIITEDALLDGLDLIHKTIGDCIHDQNQKDATYGDCGQKSAEVTAVL